MESRKRSRRQSGAALANGGNDDDDQEYHGISRSSRRQPRVDLSKLEVPTLKKYRRVFNLGGVIDSKEELVPAVARHFASQVVDEDDILLNFAFSLKKQYLARRGLLPKKAKGKSSG
eukprot:CAMPEP_0182615178 /NCGR_PEP_ID=MMETSP1330-20130603/33690_1 /TAXON_ID=464278 /ORGANISM="Picochlorum sp., Strain RCC944" /LENGTH=116 /DNA_ID=CAMNT_0024835075 /DNA_START=394 /DNA_END=741 /DNA_ORIENTATION=+